MSARTASSAVRLPWTSEIRAMRSGSETGVMPPSCPATRGARDPTRPGPPAYAGCFNRGMARALHALAGLAGGTVLAVAAVGVAPALATSGGDQGGGVVDPNAHPGAVRAQITFT